MPLPCFAFVVWMNILVRVEVCVVQRSFLRSLHPWFEVDLEKKRLTDHISYVLDTVFYYFSMEVIYLAV